MGKASYSGAFEGSAAGRKKLSLSGAVPDKLNYNMYQILAEMENVLTNGAERGIMSAGGGKMDNTGASGAIPRDNWTRMDEHAKQFYEDIRNRKSDVSSIARNTGFTEKDIRIIKNHVFFNKYPLGGEEPERFSPLYDMAISWQRLIEGKYIQEMGIVLLRHELLESHLMNQMGMSYAQAHELAEKDYNYSKYVIELDRKAGLL